jgi:hypothetical protein
VGDACGATTVDQKIIRKVEEKYSKNIENFRREEPEEYVNFLWDIEDMKMNYEYKGRKDLEIRVPKKLSKTDTVQKVNISKTKFKEFFIPTLKRMDELIMEIQENEDCRNISHLVLVGGFSNDSVIRQHIGDEYTPKYTLYIPANPTVAVLNGAVLFGQQMHLITERVCTYTCGFAVFQNFDETHDERKKIVRGGKTMAKDCFKVVFKKGEMLKVGSFREIDVYDEFLEDRVDKKREPLVVTLYSSEEYNPKYTDDASCQKLCEMKMLPPNGEWPQKVTGKVRLEVAGTELQATLYDDSNRRQDRCKFEY